MLFFKFSVNAYTIFVGPHVIEPLLSRCIQRDFILVSSLECKKFVIKIEKTKFDLTAARLFKKNKVLVIAG